MFFTQFDAAPKSDRLQGLIGPKQRFRTPTSVRIDNRHRRICKRTFDPSLERRPHPSPCHTRSIAKDPVGAVGCQYRPQLAIRRIPYAWSTTRHPDPASRPCILCPEVSVSASAPPNVITATTCRHRSSSPTTNPVGAARWACQYRSSCVHQQDHQIGPGRLHLLVGVVHPPATPRPPPAADS